MIVDGVEQSGPHGQKQTTPSTKSTFPELAANTALVLLAVSCSLLDRQLAAQAKAFETEGGFTERLYRVRSEKRSSAIFVHSVPSSSTPSTERSRRFRARHAPNAASILPAIFSSARCPILRARSSRLLLP